ncbi:MAG: type IV pilus biogenesis/stability protein PilW [Pseudomonadota bacterium]|jgi:type IV pilus assembly protein PilF
MKGAAVTVVALILLGMALHARAEGADSDQAATAARLNAQLAVGYLKQGDVTTAREKVDKALRQNEHDAFVQTVAGLVYERLQERDNADRHYARAVKLDPKDPDLQNNYGGFQCRNGRSGDGQKLFEQAARNPVYSTPEVAYANAGVCARSAGDNAKAEAYFRRALALRSDFPDALLQLADLNVQQGSALAARGLLERYFQVAPRTPESLALAVRVERAQGDGSAARRYLDELERSFPDAPQVQELRRALVP